MQSENEHVEEFLAYYPTLKSPEYAVLIRGEWGTGKTWFVKEVFELNQTDKIDKSKLYVSLNGVSSIAEIENEFFRQLHPIRSSKGAKIAGRLIKGLLKTTIRFDLDENDDGKTDNAITVSLPNEDLLNSLNLTDDTILIFDDIERCSIPICNVLGYINQFVEHEGLKVILIANEKEIDTNNEEYKKIKEKLIGKTFEVKPNIKPALEHFISLLSENKQEIFTDNLAVITDVFKSSEYNNLRILKYASLDFERILSKLTTDILDKKQLISGFLALYLALSFEIKRGKIVVSDIISTMKITVSKHVNNEEKIYPYDEHVISKYTSINFYDLELSRNIWDDIFTRGVVPIDELNECLKNSQYFLADKEANQPNWIHLWYARQKSDEEFEEILRDVERQWEAFEYDDVGVVRHIAGIFFWLSSINLYPKSNEEILTHAKLFIDKLKDNEFFCRKSSQYAAYDESYVGLGFHGKDATEFSQLSSYIKQKNEEAIRESYPEEATKLAELMKTNSLEFCQNLVAHYGYDSAVVCRFYKIPILSFMSDETFVNTFISLDQNDKRRIADIFSNRYDYYASDLIDELDWLKNVTERLEKIVQERAGKISGHSIRLMIEHNFKVAIQELEHKKQQVDAGRLGTSSM